MIRFLDAKSKNYQNKLINFLDSRRSGKNIDTTIVKKILKDVKVNKNKAFIEGTDNLEGAELMSSDLRASVALVLAAFISRGTSIINRVYHLDRGYEKIENKLKKIGVKIKRIS